MKCAANYMHFIHLPNVLFRFLRLHHHYHHQRRRDSPHSFIPNIIYAGKYVHVRVCLCAVQQNA